MSVIIVIASIIAVATSKARSRISITGPIAKVVVLGALLFGTSLLVTKSATFFGVEGADQKSVSTVFKETQRRSSQGHSEFGTTIVNSPADIPRATFSTLFRPFPWEAHNALALATALEGSYLFYLLVNRARGVVTAVKLARRRAFLGLCVIYVVAFGTAFSAVGNFGILARQRTLVLPALLALLYVPAIRRTRYAPQPALVAPG
jgi:hypothetical protein